MPKTEKDNIMESKYKNPVAKLLNFGDFRNLKEWPDYPQEFGFTNEHISQLIEMATDEELNYAASDTLEVWAPIHAWRALGQLKAEQAIEPLMQLFHELEDIDWTLEELPIVYKMIGSKAIPALAGYLADDFHRTFPRITAAASLAKIGNTHPESKEQCKLLLKKQLEHFQDSDPGLNASLITYLIDLQAVEALPIIKKSFDGDKVNLMVTGDFEDVEIAFGVRTHRSAPGPLPPLQKTAISAKSTKNKKEKIGRNEPCPCGSGKKFKKCCVKN